MFLLTFQKMFLSCWINFYWMVDDTWWEFFTSFIAVYFFLTLVIIMGWYTWVAFHCYYL